MGFIIHGITKKYCAINKMGIFQDYKQYKTYEPQYEFWKSRKDLEEAKRLEYLKQNQIDDKTKNEEIQRGKALLRAIDVMDEYSQSRAENMEIATQQAVNAIGQIAVFATTFGCFGLLKFKPIGNAIKSLIKRYPKIGNKFMLLPSILGLLTSMGFTMCLQGWAASKEVGASRNGRFEAMKNELFYASTVGVTEEKARKAVKSCKACERIKLKLLCHIEEIKKYRRAINDRRRR